MNLLVMPILIPMLTSLVVALFNGRGTLQKAISLVSCLCVTGFVFWLLFHVDNSGIAATRLGGWDAPFGIVFVADRLACIMLCLSMTVGSVVLTYTFWTVTDKQQKYFFYSLFQIVLLGVNWSFLSGDLFNLFVAYEVMLIGSYGMMMVGASKEQVLQTMKYIAINTIGSTLFVVGCGLIYATMGTLNFADLSQQTAMLSGSRAGLVTTVSMVLLVVFAMKTAAFPLFFWLPDSYPVVPAGVSGYFAGLLTKVGVYSLLRVFIMVFRQDGHAFGIHVLLVLSGFTMLLGVLGAMCQWDIRRILSWHIISQVGYMVMGIGLAANLKIAEIAIAGTIFYVVHHIIVKSCLFLIGGITERVSGTQEIRKMGGVLDLAPGVALLFIVASLSLAGMPPFSGFVSKLVLIRAGLTGGNYLIVSVAIATGFLTLYSMTKIWSYAFWRSKSRETAGSCYRGMMAPTSVLVVLTIIMGLWAQPCLSFSQRAAKSVLNPEEYIGAVLGSADKRPVSDTNHTASKTPEHLRVAATERMTEAHR